MRTVLAYIRVSTVKQGERGSSLQEQRASIEVYAKRHDLLIAQWFEEMETAAKRGRRQFNQMLTLLKRGKASGVIIHKIDRGARNLKDWADLGELIDQGVEVHFAHESLDLHSRSGRLSADIQAVVAADYIRNLREEVRKGFNGRLKQGLYPLGAPIGYKDQGGGKAKIPDPVKAPLIRQAFDLYASGQYGLIALKEELAKCGLRNRKGRPISLGGLSVILNNPFYIGLIHIKRTGETYQGIHEPIVKKRVFDAVQAVLRGKTNKRTIRHAFLYRRTLRCIHCGNCLIGERQKGRVYYRCHIPTCPKTSLREDEVSAKIQHRLGALRLGRQERAELAEEFRRYSANSRDEDAASVQATKLAIAQCGERLSRLTDAYIDRVIEKDLFEERKAALLKDRLDLEERLAELTDGTQTIDVKLKNFLELLETISDKPESLPPTELRDLAVSVTSNLGADGKYVVPDWKSPFHVVAERSPFPYSALDRDTPRTSSSKHEGVEAQSSEDMRDGHDSASVDISGFARAIIDAIRTSL